MSKQQLWFWAISVQSDSSNYIFNLFSSGMKKDRCTINRFFNLGNTVAPAEGVYFNKHLRYKLYSPISLDQLQIFGKQHSLSPTLEYSEGLHQKNFQMNPPTKAPCEVCIKCFLTVSKHCIADENIFQDRGNQGEGGRHRVRKKSH